MTGNILDFKSTSLDIGILFIKNNRKLIVVRQANKFNTKILQFFLNNMLKKIKCGIIKRDTKSIIRSRTIKK